LSRWQTGDRAEEAGVKGRKARLSRVAWGVGATAAALGLVSWGLMQIPPVNDAVLGDRPRDLGDFARMCKNGRNGEPFPRAAPYEPGVGPHPWVVFKDESGIYSYSSTGTEAKEPEWGEEPDADTVQLVACSNVSGSVPGTKITCQYTDDPLAPLGLDQGGAKQSVEFSQGLYTVAVIEARTGDLVGKRTLKGDDKVDCDDSAVEGDTAPVYTSPTWDAYADLLADVHAVPSGS
jgi:hypothetical protein